MEPSEPEKTLEEQLLEQAYIKYDIQDNEDGSYTVKYKVDEPCEVSIDVKLKNERGDLLEIRSSPKVATFSEQA
jgi:dynein heavy chain